MRRVLAVFGTRPEAIKMYPIIKELKDNRQINLRIAVTAQHREMLDGVLREFSIDPDYDLSLMTEGQSLCDLTAKALIGLRAVMDEALPDIVLVHGDTATAFSAALAAFYSGIPIAHVEAGLRTYRSRDPFPEEFYRRSISAMSDLHFAPTAGAAEALIREGIPRAGIHLTGNTAIDTLRLTVRSDYRSSITERIGDSPFLLLTLHRRESIGEPMRAVFRAVRRAAEHSGLSVVYPMHKNPAVRRIAECELSSSGRIILTEPLSVTDFHNLLARSTLVVTDSGGVQEEAAFLGKPTLVARHTTERPEALSASCRLAGIGEKEIYRMICTLLTDKEEYRRASVSTDAFGRGDAAVKIADVLVRQIFKL
ncbi:MAG: UDP-N-acetylglucosamine 2-epimerase (non-hydrolyzing) [Ruminococcaceae bacterium]|nr:UDP-N-acetylglucosamine 2-epimerase (non-hydrolyzing) [Oscillospiraceae bacterium]